MRAAPLLALLAALASALAVPVARAAVAPPSTSSNWVGYVADGIGSTSTAASSAMAFSNVTATWRQPAVVCTLGTASTASIQVGIGGFGATSTSLDETGTSATCRTNGTAVYRAWYELVPAGVINVELVVEPGDLITASVVIIDKTHVLVQVKDRTRGTDYTANLSVTAAVDQTSAEWLVQAPAHCSGGTCTPDLLASFDRVDFTHTFAKGNGIGGTITSPAWMATPIQLRQAAGRTTVIPGLLSADGGRFTVLYVPDQNTLAT